MAQIKSVWEAPRGEGYAAPAVVGERVIHFHRVNDEEIAEGLDAATGKRLWKFGYPTTYADRYGYSGGPRCPVVHDGERAFCYGAEGKLHALAIADGRLLWKRDLPREFRTGLGFFGIGAAPLVEGERLIVQIGAPGGPGVVALDTKTGATLWKSGKEWGASYAAPVAATLHGRRRVLVFAGGESRPSTGGLLCLDPATGAIDFQFPWRARRYESVNGSSPVVIGNRIFLSECYGAGGVLLEALPDRSCKTLWTSRALGTHFMTAVHKDGFLYGVDGHGPYNAPLVCLDLATGKERWRIEPEWPWTVGRQSVPRMPGRAWLTPLPDGRCLALGEFGHLAWLDLNPNRYRELARVQLFAAEQTWTEPVLRGGKLFVCQNEPGVDGTKRRLLCYAMAPGGAKP